MKKLLSILLIFIYSTASFGMSVKEYYCCGKLTSGAVSLVSGNNEQTTCTMQTKACSGCCKTKSHLLKVKDNHIASGAVALTAKHFTHTGNINFTELNTVAIADTKLGTSIGINDPPLLHSSIPTYLFIRVIRI
jgi:hypothetical protein